MRRAFPLFASLSLLPGLALAAEDEALIALPSVHTIVPDASVVPTNAVVFGLGGPGAIESAGLTVSVEVAGERAPASFESVEAVQDGIPRASLVRVPVVGNPGEEVVVEFEMRGGQTSAAFTFGSGDDGTPPVFPAGGEIALALEEPKAGWGRMAVYGVAASAPRAEDDVGVALYIVERSLDGGELVPVEFIPASAAGADISWSDYTSVAGAFAPAKERLCYRLRALDVAGNEAVLEGEHCVSLESAGGCGASSSSAAAVFALLPALWLFRSRRERRRGGRADVG